MDAKDRIRDVVALEISKIPDECKKCNVCYVLRSATAPARTYCGSSVDLVYRLRQHNGLITGGARATSTSRPWTVACVVTGFLDRSETLRYEFFCKMKHSKAAYDAALRAGANSIKRRAVLLRAAESKMTNGSTLKYHMFDECLKGYLNEIKPPPTQTKMDEFVAR